MSPSRIFRYSRILCPVVLALLTLIAYVPALRSGYVWDDDVHVTHNATLRTLDGLRRIWFELDALPQYYPLVHTTFWCEYRIWGLEPSGYHLVNVLLHIVNALLFWLLLRRLGVPGAWLAASVFALHPVHVESVAWITERKNLLSGLFYLISALCFLRFFLPQAVSGGSASARSAEVEEPPRRDLAWGCYAAGFLAFVLALLSKTVSASLPLALVVVIWWKKGRIERRDLAALAPLVCVGAVMGFLTVWIEKHHVGAQGQEWAASFFERSLIAGRASWFYLGKLLWPAKLTFFYPRWNVDASQVRQALYPLAAAAAILGLWSLRRRLGKGPLAAGLFFLLTLAPALGFFDVFPMRYSYVADHFQYLASLGPLALIGALAARWLEPPRPHSHPPAAPRRSSRVWRRLPALGLLLVLGALTWKQAHVYGNAETLWRDTLAKNPGAWAAHNNLGLLLARRGDHLEAIDHYSEALGLNPDFVEAHVNLGNVLLKQGRADAAIAHYFEAVRLKPDYLIAQYNLATALLTRGRNHEAIERLAEVIRLEPALAPAHEKLAVALQRDGRAREAAAHEAEALRLRAWFLATHENPSVRDGRLAVQLAERARQGARDEPAATQASMLDTLAASYAESGRFAEAVEAAQRALELARASSRVEMARAIDARLKGYEAGRPFRDPSLNRLTVIRPLD